MKKLNITFIRKGLTLVELAIVMLVLGIVMAIVYSGLDLGTIDKAKGLKVRTMANTLEANLGRYEAENGSLSDGTKLDVLTQSTETWRGLKADQVLDPWKRSYFICSDNIGNRQICSNGANGVPGGAGQDTDFYLTDQSSWPKWLKAR